MMDSLIPNAPFYCRFAVEYIKYLAEPFGTQCNAASIRDGKLVLEKYTDKGDFDLEIQLERLGYPVGTIKTISNSYKRAGIWNMKDVFIHVKYSRNEYVRGIGVKTIANLKECFERFDVEYKTFKGSVLYDANECVFCGSILHLTFTALSKSSVQTEFEKTVDNYLGLNKEVSNL